VKPKPYLNPLVQNLEAELLGAKDVITTEHPPGAEPQVAIIANLTEIPLSGTLENLNKINGAVEKTRTSTGCPATTSR
jgi:hypothetical protein